MLSIFFSLISIVYYFRNSSPSEPCPNSHQTGDVFSGGIWQGRLMRTSYGSSPTTRADTIIPGSTYYYRFITFSTEPLAAQSVPSDTWAVTLSCSEFPSSVDGFLRYKIYTWSFQNDTIGSVIVDTRTGTTEFPNKKEFITEKSVGNAFTLQNGDKICVCITLEARGPGSDKYAYIYYGGGGDTSKLHTPINILSSNLVEMSAIVINEGVMLQFNGREDSKGRYWKILRSEDLLGEFKIIDSVFIKNSNMHSFIDKNVSSETEYYYKIYDEFNNEFGPLKVFVTKIGYDFSISPVSSFSRDRYVFFYSADKEGEATINIYDKSGKLIKRLLNNYVDKGMRTVIWNGKDKNGKDVPPDIYFYIYKLDNRKITGKLIKIE